MPSTAAQQPKGDASQSRKASGSKEKRQAAAATAADDDASLNVDDFNPVVLGRKSRHASCPPPCWAYYKAPSDAMSNTGSPPCMHPCWPCW